MEGAQLELEFLQDARGWTLERVRFRPRSGAGVQECFRGDRFARAGRSFAWTKSLKALCLLLARYVLNAEEGSWIEGDESSPAQTLFYLWEHPERSSAAAPFTEEDGLCHLKSLLEVVNAGRSERGKVKRRVCVAGERLPAGAVRLRFLDGDVLGVDALRGMVAEWSGLWPKWQAGDAGGMAAPELELGHFPMTGGLFVGREEELKLLDAELDRGPVLQVVGVGGGGKTVLLGHWLERRLREGRLRYERVFGWSFAEQSHAQDQTMSADACFEALMNFCGVEMPDGSAFQRGVMAARAAAMRSTLVLLDGLEGLQQARGAGMGEPHDPAVRGFLHEAVRCSTLNCVLVSRLALPDLGGVRTLKLGPLDAEAGGVLLNRMGGSGGGREMAGVVRGGGGHPLTLRLLGGYLHRAYGGRAGAAVENDALLAIADVPGVDHARRVMEGYEEQMQGMMGGVMLWLLSVFDHGVSFDGFCDFIFDGPKLPGITDGIGSSAMVRGALGELNEAGLISWGELIQCHALVAEHFGESFRRRQPEAYRQAHLWMYEKIRGDQSIPEHPVRREEYEALLRAFRHAREAGRLAECWQELAWRRIMRGGREYHMTGHLGEFHLCLRAWASFWEVPWERLHPDLPTEAHPIAQASAGFGLSMINRVEEGERVLRRALSRSLRRARPQHAMQAAAVLGYVCMAQGRYAEARRILTPVANVARWVGSFTDAPPHVLLAPVCHLAYCVFAEGRRERARRLFDYAIRNYGGLDGWVLPPLLLVTYWRFLVESGELEEYRLGREAVVERLERIPLVQQLGLLEALEAREALEEWRRGGGREVLKRASAASLRACEVVKANGFMLQADLHEALRLEVMRAHEREGRRVAAGQKIY
ncbi:hypothetical protein [Phragmitibacter flavus]|uniref:hypothetical protein n=1 Tax=Phragmitibacter flavus TaxID=2576071 RepID=UPI00140924D5|nr:hypothetical protein [Phragmitibacter flavus]